MAKTGFDPRKLMEQAIEVMRKSVHEPRSDGKASPMVGAVLRKPNGTVETMCRGELRYGAHAEYALLERKNRDQKLDDTFLFTTMEPCAPGSRRHPKLSCAERIVLARIKEIWVGIEDPDPTVDRKGIKYMQDSGVTVHMFDRDLQEIIHKENREFVTRALERAAAVQEEKKPRPSPCQILRTPLQPQRRMTSRTRHSSSTRLLRKSRIKSGRPLSTAVWSSKDSSGRRTGVPFRRASDSFSSEKNQERSFRKPGC